MDTKIFLFTILLIVTPLLSAQDKISLTEIEKVKEYLSLNEVQYNSIKNIVKGIESILKEDKKIINELKDRIKNDDEPGFFEKIRVKNGRSNRADDIEDLIEEIEEELNDQQKIKFKDIKKPKLDALKKEDIFGK